jgi:hypothetical protein
VSGTADRLEAIALATGFLENPNYLAICACGNRSLAWSLRINAQSPK